MQGDPVTITFSLASSTGAYESISVIAENLNNDDEQTLSTAPYQSLSMDTSTWEAGNQIIELHIQEEYPMLGGEAGPTIKSYPIFVDVYIETSNRLAFAEMLVSNIVDEASVTVTNVRYVGVMAASTNFVNGEKHGLQIDEGIIMTTGSARLWNLGVDRDDTDESATPTCHLKTLANSLATVISQ